MKRLILFIFCMTFMSGTVFAIDFINEGGRCDGVTDDSPALSKLITSASTGKDKEIHLPSGQCVFKKQLPALRNGVSIIGQGKSNTVLIVSYSDGAFFVLRDNGSRIENLSIYKDKGKTGGIAIQMLSDNDGVGGNHLLENIWVTGTGTWSYGVGGWGNTRTIAPIGLRTVTFRDVSVFNATFQSVILWDCINCQWYGGGIYQGFGTVQNLVVGGPNAVNNYFSLLYDKGQAIIYPSSVR